MEEKLSKDCFLTDLRRRRRRRAMIWKSTSSSFQQNNQQEFQIYQGIDDVLYLSTSSAGVAAEPQPSSSSSHNLLLYNFSLLKEKVQQLEPFVTAVISPIQIEQESFCMNVAGAGNIVQEIIVAASTTMCNLQQLGPAGVRQSDYLPPDHNSIAFEGSSSHHEAINQWTQTNFFSAGNCTSLGGNPANFTSAEDAMSTRANTHTGENVINQLIPAAGKRRQVIKECLDCDIIELDAADLLAKYTQYCQVCGQGFRRDANLRMHMRAHGDEYKTAGALSNPMKIGSGGSGGSVGEVMRRKFSCPQEGCRWNKGHPSFQPLKSMVCVKNHYKRSHCPKMYMCKRCNVKQFSVPSDLRTHEKHCGDLRWRCSCGTNFSRKDKLMGHVALFIGHSPALDRLP